MFKENLRETLMTMIFERCLIITSENSLQEWAVESDSVGAAAVSAPQAMFRAFFLSMACCAPYRRRYVIQKWMMYNDGARLFNTWGQYSLHGRGLKEEWVNSEFALVHAQDAPFLCVQNYRMLVFQDHHVT